MFCRVNHHLNPILVSFGFILRKVKDSFVWFFQEFLNYRGHAPSITITYHDCTIKVAIPIVFPNTFQHFCKWHITHKFVDKIGNVYQDKQAMEELHEFLNNAKST